MSFNNELKLTLKQSRNKAIHNTYKSVVNPMSGRYTSYDSPRFKHKLGLQQINSTQNMKNKVALNGISSG
jgi:hypothetical protein